MGKFSDSPYFILESYIANLDPYGHIYPQTAHLIGPNTGIVAQGGFGCNLWVKTDERYYRIRVRNISGTPDDNKFQFHLETENYKASELTPSELGEYAGSEVYFRKEGTFHGYIDSIETYENYVNTNRLWIYFGKIYPTSSEYIFNVIFDHLMYYTYRALPMTNRNANIKEFFETFFDKIFTEVYSLQKNTWTLQDPIEVNEKYLEYIYNMYDSSIPNLTVQKQREAAGGLPAFLKRKGTYASLYIIWRSIVLNTTNHLNVYERWHDWPLPGGDIVPLPYFEDYLYTSYPYYNTLPPKDGAGEVYYHGLPLTAPYLGYYTHEQTAEVAIWNISHNLEEEYVIIETVDLAQQVVIPDNIEVLNSNNIRVTFPIAVAGHASVVSGCREWDTVAGTTVDTGRYEHSQTTASTSWPVNHNLGIKYGVVEIYDENGEVIKPSFIEFIDENLLMVSFDVAIAGTAVVVTGLKLGNTYYGSYLHREINEKTEWLVNHNLDREFVNVEVIDNDDITILPDVIEIYDENIVNIRFSEGVAGRAVIVGGAGTRKPVYPTFGYGNNMITPHYRMEIDLANEPLDNTEILSQNTIEQLVTKWDEMRPVCRYKHYTLLVAPSTNFSGNYVSLYDESYSAGLYTVCTQAIDVTAGMVLHTQEGAASTWIINHNMNSDSVVVQTFDTNREMMIPDRVDCTTPNQVVIEFAGSVAGYALISPPGVIDYSNSALIWNIAHLLHGPGINLTYFLTQIENEARETMMPLTLTVGVQSVTVTFVQARAGYTLVEAGDYIHNQTIPSPIWQVDHNLDAMAVQVQCFDENDRMIFPNIILLKDQNRTTIRFATYERGHVVVKKISRGVDSMNTLIGRISTFKIGTGGGASWDYSLANDIETPVAEGIIDLTGALPYSEDDKYYYVDGTINSGVVGSLTTAATITEIGIFDDAAPATDNIIFYTYCSNIHKPLDAEFKIHMRVRKTT